jgi:hypothetical protein
MLGLLQRGRGAGYVRALGDPAGAADLVVDCIVRDPRWDHQVEARSWYYAGLVHALGVDLARLRAAYVDPLDGHGDVAAWLATAVLELCARRHVKGAVAELLRYLDSGRDLSLALQHLLPLAGHPGAAGLFHIVDAVGPAELGDALWSVEDLAADPWPQWRQASRTVASAIEATAARGAPTELSTDAARRAREQATRDRLVQVGKHAAAGTPAARLVGLADGDDEVLLEVASALLEDETLTIGVRAAIRRTLRNLDSPRALAWARANASLDGEGGRAALHLLAGRAVASDVPKLRHLLEIAAADRDPDMYSLSSLVDGLGRLADTAAVALFEALFDTTVYSYLRRRCARALSATSASFPAGRAIECLWDCEAETRAIAIAEVDTDDPTVRSRLAQIACDPTENQQTATAAANRRTTSL